MSMLLFVTKRHENYIYAERKTFITEKPGSQFSCNAMQPEVHKILLGVALQHITIYSYVTVCVYMHFWLHHVTSKNCKPG